MSRVIKTGDWQGGRLLTNSKKFAFHIQTEFNKALLVNGEILRAEMISGIRKNTLGLKALSEVTTTAKGSAVPLADRGDMTGSIKSKLVAPGFVFVGIPRGAHKRGKDLWKIAEIMENGHFKGVNLSTPKGRAAMKALAVKVRKRNKKFQFKKGTGAKSGFIFTPARPFMEPAFRKASPKFNATNLEAARRVWKKQKGA